MPSAALVRVLADFGITAANARATLSRLTQREVLERHRDGRRTSYGLTDDAWRVLVRGARRIFAAGEEADWDGAWTLVAFSLSGTEPTTRRLLRARLRWLTFAPIFDATWVTPHDRVAQVRDQLDELGVANAFVVRTADLRILPDADGRLRATWDLATLARRYDEFRARHARFHADATAGRVTPSRALVGRTELVDDWRGLVRDDPDLPAELLPDPFPRRPARQLFLGTYRAVESPARARFAVLTQSTADTSP